MQELHPLHSPHSSFSCLSPCSSWDTGHSGKQPQFPSSICPGHKGIRSRSLTVSRSRKHRPAQSLGGNYLLIASVSQKHHSNSSWDSHFYPANKHLGSFISILVVKFRSGVSPSPTLSCPLPNGSRISPPAPTLTSSSPSLSHYIVI